MRPKFAVGFRAWCVAFVLGFGMIAHAAEQHSLMGASRDEVLDRYGEPRSTLLAGNRELLFYPNEKLTLRNGRVVDVERLTLPTPSRPPPPEKAASETTSADEATPPVSSKRGDVPAPKASSKDASAPSAPASPVPEPPSPAAESRLEIKRVLPPGTSAPRSAPKNSSAAPQPTTPSPATVAPAPSASEVLEAPTNQSPAASIATPAAPAGATLEGDPVAAVSSSAADRKTGVAERDAAETPDSADEKKAAPLSKDEAAKRAAEIAAERRQLDSGQLEDVDPSAAFFTGRTYLIAFFLITGGIGYLVWRRRQRQLELAATAVSQTPFNAPVGARPVALFTTEVLSKLEWKRFEELVVAYYSKTGVVATRTKSGPQAPVQIKISWKGEPRPFALVQCIAQAEGLIDVKPIQELFNVLAAEDIRRGYVVTNGKFNVPARDFAEEKHITLLPGDIFVEKLNALPDNARSELMQQISTGDSVTPSCPKCEAKMVRSEEDPAMFRCPVHPEQQIAAPRS